MAVNRMHFLLALMLQLACATSAPLTKRKDTHPHGVVAESGVPATPTAVPAAVACGDGTPMRVHFYDVGQALAALIELPTGQLILVDAGESANRPGCGEPCGTWNAHLMSRLRADVGKREIALLWVTHPHSDHMGGAASIVSEFHVAAFADNGSSRSKAGVRKLLEQVKEHGVSVDLTTTDAPGAHLSLTSAVQVHGVVPSAWSVDCDRKPNDCSAGLRVDYCESSVLFVGDAEMGEEAELSVKHADVLQVGHHGSNTSSSAAFLAKVQPKWAVISSGKRAEGTNAGYCHPRAVTIEVVSAALGDTGGRPVEAFTGGSCKSGGAEEWKSVPASRRLFVTARDGDVTLVTGGDGEFKRE